MLDIALTYVAVASAITMALYGLDKLFARMGARRIPERTLLFASFIGGALGGLVGMILFRHKTRKPRFFTVNILSLLLHAAVICMLAIPSLF